MPDSSNKVRIVTGTSGVIGDSFAIRLTRDGHRDLRLGHRDQYRSNVPGRVDPSQYGCDVVNGGADLVRAELPRRIALDNMLRTCTTGWQPHYHGKSNEYSDSAL
jgi:hypothetical protein